MGYPIKYIENNLVFNHDGETFAYYELLPYNYSFLSEDEKIQVHDHFRQLIAQNQDGKIHALQVSIKSMGKSVTSSLSSFIREVNHHVMGDFVSMPHAEIERFLKMESLLQNKIAKRFKVRPLTKDDMGYLIEHLHGQSGIAFEDYNYELAYEKGEKETYIKQFDLIKPTRCLITESQRYIKLEQEEQTTYAAYFTINSIVGDLEF